MPKTWGKLHMLYSDVAVVLMQKQELESGSCHFPIPLLFPFTSAFEVNRKSPQNIRKILRKTSSGPPVGWKVHLPTDVPEWPNQSLNFKPTKNL